MSVHSKTNDDGSVTLPLEYPVKDVKDGTLIDEVTIRRPKVKDLKMADDEEGDIAESVVLISGLSGLRKSEVEAMDFLDFKSISGVIQEFTKGKPQAAGE